MIKESDILEALLNEKIKKHFSYNPSKFECYICGSKINYKYLVEKGENKIFTFQRGFNGANRIICERCFRISCHFDKIVSKIMLLIFGWIKWKKKYLK